MKIRRFASLATSVQFTPDQAAGKWCLYDDVKPLLERIKELERQLEFERSLEDKM